MTVDTRDTEGGFKAVGDVLPANIRLEDVPANCDRHGPFVATRMTGFGPAVSLSMCPGCRAEADQREAQARDGQRIAERAQAQQQRLAERLATAGIPKRFQACDFDGFKIDAGTAHEAAQRKAVQFARAYAGRWERVREAGKVLVLHGPPGTGKTHLACAIANTVMREHAATCTFGTATDYVRGVKAAFQRDSGKSEQAAIKDLVQPDLLVMDELGQRMTDYDQQVIFDVINMRYAQMRPMVLLSNLNESDLAQLLGERMADRIHEVGTFMPMDWPSHRARART